MKKNWFNLFLLMAIAVMPLTSCDNDDDPQPPQPGEEQHDPKSDSDLTEITAYNSLSWLQGAIVLVDGSNNVVRRIYGEPLDPSLFDVLSAPVGSYATAEKIFLSWVAPGKTATKVEGGYDYNLTDEDGKAQGSVSFRAVEGEDGVVARMTVAKGTDLKQVSEVNFIDSKFWPENATPWIKVKEGEIETRWDGILTWEDGFYIKTGKIGYYTIQGNTDGKTGILISLCPDYNDSDLHPRPEYYTNSAAFDYLPSEWEAEQILDFFNNHKDKWDEMMEKMASLGYDWYPKDGSGTTGNAEFMVRKHTVYVPLFSEFITCLDLDEDDSDGVKGNLRDVNICSFYKYRYMRVLTFPPVD